jgi:uncharacterized protein
MLFKRRNKAHWWERFRLSLWPRVSWRRSWTYYAKRILRLQATPHAIAAGAAAGAAVSFAPLVGFHFLLAFLLAFVLRGNLLAAAFGTAVGNPLTFPIMWAASYQAGSWIMKGKAAVMPSRLVGDLMEQSFEQLWPVMQPILVGALPVGLLGGIVMYVVIYKVVSVYQAARRERLAQVQALKLKKVAAVKERLKGATQAAKSKVKSLREAGS